ncbi:hypothetical protein DM02DRAFT_626598 [Periconia macrospinosa]|uniref:Uncharacterized protein n=1 Tax=Periconia macrospinosa TaxID=97972 RepID=A0A2V1DYW1_9PLEO|nr:hypothetical protein DM02DRAFT_626598 [Periconia macrospinosa]
MSLKSFENGQVVPVNDSDITEKSQQPPLNLLSLPNELLLKIGDFQYPTDSPQGRIHLISDLRNPSLCQLALTCRRLRNIAQENMFVRCHLKARKLALFVRAILDRPDLTIRIKEFIFDEEGGEHPFAIGFDPNDTTIWVNKLYEEYGDSANVLAANASTEVIGTSRAPYYMALALILAKIPKVERFYIQNNFKTTARLVARRLIGPRSAIATSLFQQSVFGYGNQDFHVASLNRDAKLRELFQKKVENLYLTSYGVVPRYGQFALSPHRFSNLPNLKHLATDVYNPPDSLPESLESFSVQLDSLTDFLDFKIRSDHVKLFRWIKLLTWSSDLYLSLKTVEVHYRGKLSYLLAIILDATNLNTAAPTFVDTRKVKRTLRRWSIQPYTISFHVIGTDDRPVVLSSQDLLQWVECLEDVPEAKLIAFSHYEPNIPRFDEQLLALVEAVWEILLSNVPSPMLEKLKG